MRTESWTAGRSGLEVRMYSREKVELFLLATEDGMGLAAGAMTELVDGGVDASAAGFGCGLAFAAVIDHTLDDGFAKAHDIIVVDGGSGCEEAVGKVHMSLAKEFDGKGDNGGLVDHDVIEQPFHGRSNLNAGNLIDVAQRDYDARDDFGVDTSGAGGDDLGGAR